jgi:hypothetical protein
MLVRTIALALGVVLAAGVGVALVDDGDRPNLRSVFDSSNSSSDSSDSSDSNDGADVTTLHEDCADGDYAACDELYYQSDVGSDEEEFGSTCGDRYEENDGDCETNYG